MSNIMHIGKTKIKQDGEGRFCLNDLHKAAGGEAKHAPAQWMRHDQFKSLAMEIVRKSTVSPVEAKTGRNGGTYVSKPLVYAYAMWISAKFQLAVIDVFDRFARADASLAIDITERATKEDQKRIAARANGIVARNQLTSTLGQHGVTGDGYRLCTNATYKGLFGATAGELRDRRNLPAKANIREHMSHEELIATSFSEMLARNSIEANAIYGNNNCARECNLSAQKVGRMVIESKVSA
jgi:hypothetical protein